MLCAFFSTTGTGLDFGLVGANRINERKSQKMMSSGASGSQAVRAARLCRVLNLSAELLPYPTTHRLQKILVEQCWRLKQTEEPCDFLVFVQHHHVYTLGRGGDPKNLLSSGSQSTTTGACDNQKIPVYRIERGGDITYHGPGQIIAYPIFDLTSHKKDLHWFASSLEQTVIDNLHRNYGITNAGRNSLNNGVWIDNRKIAAQGVAASRWITSHGIATNISCDMSYFKQIIPCGLDPTVAGVVSLREIISHQSSVESSIDLQEFVRNWTASFAKVFSLSAYEEPDPSGYIQNLHVPADIPALVSLIQNEQ